MSEGLKRRDFLKVLGAGGAGAATAGCSTSEVERLIPFVVPAEEIVPGVPTWYTSTCRECPAGCGVHVETHSGRATKVEGNPDNPISRGNLCARGQASVQGLYNPDRFRGPVLREGVQTLNPTWGTAERLVAQQIRGEQQGGREVVFLTRSYSGSMDSLVDEWVAAVGAQRVVYDVWADQPRGLDFSQADVLVSFGADFLETWGSPVDYAWQFAQMHSYRQGRRGKFIWVAPHRPLTGINADQWIAPLPGTEVVLAQALGGQVDVASAAQATEVPQETIEQLIGEFTAGNGIVLGPGAAISGSNASDLRDVLNGINAGRAGPVAPSQPSSPELINLIERMRQGQVGLVLLDAPNPVYTLPGALGFAEALGQVPTRVSFSPFPDDTTELCTMVLPDHHFLEAWDDYIPAPGVFEIVQPTMRPVFNTKQTGDVLLSLAREMGIDTVAGGATTYYEYLRSQWAGISGEGDGWRQALQRGGVFPSETPAAAGTALAGPEAPADPTADAPEIAGLVAAAVAVPPEQAQDTVSVAPAGSIQPIAFEGDGDANFHLVVYPSYRFFDGRLANRPWLLELPDPVTKVPWGSWVEIHPTTAEAMGIEQGDIVEVASQFGSLETFAYIYPGVRPDVVAIQTGLGHNNSFGRFAEDVGVNPNALLGPFFDQRSGRPATYGQRVRLSRIGEVSTRGGFNPGDGLFEQGTRVQHDRELAQAVSVASLAQLEAEATPEIPGENEPITNLRGAGGFMPRTQETDPAAYPPPGTEYGEYIQGMTRWAMVIDLDRCIGCSACVTACYAENNIPVVGPNEVKRGRDLSWLRIERYWGVTDEAEEALDEHALDDTRFLPMLCQHCGNAPCEPVCPVYASYHTPDGLNGQVYNRCVGTRYCANNCPYKVRYFNWFTYKFDEPLNWQLNPDVAVREKGVMEKCTFCVQRIRENERAAALENRPVRDGEIVPACVQTCPTEVFVFGNIANPESQVAEAARSVRGYRALDLLNVQPAIVYLKKVTLQEPAQGGHEAEAATAAN
ncbi:MAG: 4Fe-4S dicluster domain-containing protein [Gemmatimonas sp.]|nr:4Fe-4S dicluster domain-containing protein [Gemmatimonas sp.]